MCDVEVEAEAEAEDVDAGTGGFVVDVADVEDVVDMGLDGLLRAMADELSTIETWS